jgi:arsenate reductase (thioredoxin)
MNAEQQPAPGKTAILFLCTGNSARSQMGEALLRKHAGDSFEVYSAGIEPKGMNPYTVRVMQEIGLDLSGQRSKSVSEYLGRVKFGYVITVCGDAEKNCPTIFLTVSNRYFWPFDDPAAAEGSDEEKLAQFRQVRDQIDQRIQAWLAEQEVAAHAA